MSAEHSYQVTVRWTGNTGTGTAGYRTYDRSHDVAVAGKPTIRASADPAFRGSPDRWNPEDLLVASLSECHMLTYLSLCARNGVVVTGYQDAATGRMRETPEGGHFTEVVLHPVVSVAEAGMAERAMALHEQAHRSCFIASSVNFPVRHEASVQVRATSA
ncbi:OsmC family protein [Goodfellowiella coeruleoviolacea]|uniref:Organic hydroperoxide reductase OsmC/OhrA n=1 Tax=Goodfellowiella coeruleoviolacea TaxID=334858 RepID=A0AAE3GJ01_9PSEU|nr:OsmC family protein [Goodfellowiella coeruleoviolacea]MCP2168498.1 Organic hydroperoxide reductase OsmC/OhrA [Goodfellowiella coeruleoviolacea]